MNNLWLKTWAAILFLCLPQLVWAQGLNAYVNSDKVALGDTFQLVLTSKKANTPTPELAPLRKDFSVVGTSQSSQTQIINEARSSQISWTISLQAKKTGKLIIPAIHAGSLSSRPLSVVSLDASQTPKAQGTKGIALSVNIEQGNHYPFQEIPLTLRIESVESIQQAQLSEPAGENFELTQTGEDKASQIRRNGQLINVVERQYLLRSQVSGDITIPPFVLKGSVADPTNQIDPFFSGMAGSLMQQMGVGSMMNPGKPFRVRSDELILQIQPAPAGTGKSDEWFLPAKAVALEARWLDTNPNFETGKSYSRQISILALGATPEQLPDLQLPEIDGAEFYIDDSQTSVFNREEGTVARKDITVSVIPTQPGEIILPEVKLSWFDTESQKQKTARLEQEIIRVTGAALETQQASAPAEDQALQALKPQTSDTTTGEMPAVYLLWLTLALLACLTSFYYWRRQQGQDSRNNSFNEKNKETPTRLMEQVSNKECFSELVNAVKSADAEKAYKALLNWLQTSGQKPQSQAWQQQISELENRLFSQNQPKERWNNKALLTLLTEWQKKHQSSETNKALPSLYPATSVNN